MIQENDKESESSTRGLFFFFFANFCCPTLYQISTSSFEYVLVPPLFTYPIWQRCR